MTTALLDPPVSADALRRSLTGSAVTVGPNTDSLLSLLQEHDVRIYPPAAIKAYKTAKVQQVTRRGQILARLARGSLLWTFVALIISGAAGFIIAVVTSQLPAVMVGIFIGGPILVISECVVICVGRVKTARWGRYSVANYTSPLPTAATELVDRLRAYTPRVSFTVDELKVGSRIIDPLLNVHFGDATFCIAVWDEPGLDTALKHAELVH